MLETACACVRLYFWDMLGMVQAGPGWTHPALVVTGRVAAAAGRAGRACTAQQRPIAAYSTDTQ